MPSFLAVIRTEPALEAGGLKDNGVGVFSLMPLCSPPMTPATALAFRCRQSPAYPR